MLVTMKAFLVHVFMRGGNVRLNILVIAITLGISLISSIKAGIIPAWRTPNRIVLSNRALLR